MGASDSPMFLEQWLQSLLDDNRELVCFSEGWWVFRTIYPLTVPEQDILTDIKTPRSIENKLTDTEACNARLVEQVEQLTAELAKWKQDAERLAKHHLSITKENLFHCSYCGYITTDDDGIMVHQDNCPITLHRELVAKYKETK